MEKLDQLERQARLELVVWRDQLDLRVLLDLQELLARKVTRDRLDLLVPLEQLVVMVLLDLKDCKVSRVIKVPKELQVSRDPRDLVV